MVFIFEKNRKNVELNAYEKFDVKIKLEGKI